MRLAGPMVWLSIGQPDRNRNLSEDKEVGNLKDSIKKIHLLITSGVHILCRVRISRQVYGWGEEQQSTCCNSLPFQIHRSWRMERELQSSWAHLLITMLHDNGWDALPIQVIELGLEANVFNSPPFSFGTAQRTGTMPNTLNCKQRSERCLCLAPVP